METQRDLVLLEGCQGQALIKRLDVAYGCETALFFSTSPASIPSSAPKPFRQLSPWDCCSPRPGEKAAHLTPHIDKHISERLRALFPHPCPACRGCQLGTMVQCCFIKGDDEC